MGAVVLLSSTAEGSERVESYHSSNIMTVVLSQNVTISTFYGLL